MEPNPRRRDASLFDAFVRVATHEYAGDMQTHSPVSSLFPFRCNTFAVALPCAACFTFAYVPRDRATRWLDPECPRRLTREMPSDGERATVRERNGRISHEGESNYSLRTRICISCTDVNRSFFLPLHCFFS